MAKPILFLDRDGTIISEVPDGKINALDKFITLPGAISALRRIVQEGDYDLVIVSNQDGLGTEEFPDETFYPYHEKLMQILEGEGITFREVLIDTTYEREGKSTRKPGTGLVTHYMNGLADMSRSFMVGDRVSDLELAENMGCRGIFIAPKSKSHPKAALTTEDWHELADFVLGQPRKVAIERETKETKISGTLALDGTGKHDISTGLGFLDHMLEQWCVHGGLDIDLAVDGDLQVDEHHTIEDTGLALGKAFSDALGEKKGIGRYGFMVPMDESEASVSLDFSGRPHLEWNVSFDREMIGDVPTEMFAHFFRSFADQARCTLHITAKGENNHHIAEAVFKAVAKALQQAVAKSGRAGVTPSSKGAL